MKTHEKNQPAITRDSVASGEFIDTEMDTVDMVRNSEHRSLYWIIKDMMFGEPMFCGQDLTT